MINIKSFPMADIHVIEKEQSNVRENFEKFIDWAEGKTEQPAPVNKVVVEGGRKTLTDKETQEQLNDAWYVKHRGIAYNFGAAGINVIGEEAE